MTENRRRKTKKTKISREKEMKKTRTPFPKMTWSNPKTTRPMSSESHSLLMSSTNLGHFESRIEAAAAVGWWEGRRRENQKTKNEKEES